MVVHSSAGMGPGERFHLRPVALWATDAERRLTFLVGQLPNHAGAGAVGRTVEEVLGVADASDLAVASHLAALRGAVQSFRYTLDGHTLDIQIWPCRDGDGAVVGCAAAAVDVTAESDASSLLETTLESTADGLLVVDREGRIRRYNQRFLAMWSLSADDLEGGDEACWMAVAAPQLEDPYGFMLRADDLRLDPDVESVDVLPLKDGRVFERYTKPHRLDGRSVGRVWSFRDVTDREQSLRRATLLAETSRILGSLEVERALGALCDLVVGSMADRCVVDLVTEEGPKRVTSAGQRPSLGSPNTPPLTAFPSAVLESSDEGSLIIVPLTASGTQLGTMSFAIARGGKRYTDADLGVAREVARRVALAIENERLYRQAKEALHARDEFLSIAAHEIRGPLSGIHLAAQYLDRIGSLPAAAKKPVELIIREDRRLGRFVEELLDVTKIRSGGVRLDIGEVVLEEVVRDAVARAARELSSSPSPITIAVDGGIVGQWDRSRVVQIVTNLLSNAVKFGRGRPISVNASVRDGTATLIVEDHGIGIPVDRRDLIFNPFERAVSVRHYGGLGLGLYVVHRLVTSMGGTVAMASRVGEGTIFTVSLPLAREP